MLLLWTGNVMGISTMAPQEFELDNGLKIIVREDHRTPVVATQIWYKVGAADEYAGITGISHALEHMMFKGTSSVPGDGYSELIARNGGQDNAFTAEDFTAYYTEVAASKLELVLELEADRMQNLLLHATDFAQEKKVILEERQLRIDDSPLSITQERFTAAANVTGPYHDPIIGWRNDIEQLTIADLRAWYNNWYGPNNAVLVVVGDVKAQAVYELAKRHFGNINARAPLITKRFNEIPALGKRTLEVNIPANLSYLLMGYQVPSLGHLRAKDSWQAYALLVAVAALDGGESARFAKHLVRGQELAATASAYYDPVKRYPALLQFSALPRQGVTPKEMELAILEQIEQLKIYPLSEQELAKVKTLLIADEMFQKDSMLEQAMTLGSLVSVGSTWQEAEAFVARIEAVSAEQVQTVVQQYLVPNQGTVAVLVPKLIHPEASESAHYVK